MDLEKMLRMQTDNDQYVRASTRHYTYQDIGKWIAAKIDNPDYNKLELGADIMKHILEQLETSKSLMENTEVGKKMKDVGVI